MDAPTHVLLSVDEGIATVTINRPKALNALNAATLDDLAATLDAIDARDDVGAIVLTGAGSKAFVAGADISQMVGLSSREAEAFSKKGSDLFARIESSPLPVVAAVNGFALGGGCELMLACDFAIASSNARFGQPEVNLGLIAGFGGTQRLTRKVPYGIAMELLVTGRMIKADEALRIGLVNRVVEPDALMDTVLGVVREILSKGPVAVRLTRDLVRSALDTTLADGLTDETAGFGRVFESEDAREGMTAFLEKRRATFSGC